MTKRFLDSNHVEYREINLDEQPLVEHVKNLASMLLQLFKHRMKYFRFSTTSWKKLS